MVPDKHGVCCSVEGLTWFCEATYCYGRWRISICRRSRLRLPTEDYQLLHGQSWGSACFSHHSRRLLIQNDDGPLKISRCLVGGTCPRVIKIEGKAHDSGKAFCDRLAIGTHDCKSGETEQPHFPCAGPSRSCAAKSAVEHA